jgi:hypothetical protein
MPSVEENVTHSVLARWRNLGAVPSLLWAYLGVVIANWLVLLFPGYPDLSDVPLLPLALCALVVYGTFRGQRLAWAVALLWHSGVALLLALLVAPPYPAGDALLLGLQVAAVGLLVSPQVRAYVGMFRGTPSNAS